MATVKVKVKKIYEAKEREGQYGKYYTQGIIVVSNGEDKTVSTVLKEGQALPVKEGDECFMNLTQNGKYLNVKLDNIMPIEEEVPNVDIQEETPREKVEPKTPPYTQQTVTPIGDTKNLIVRQHTQKVAVEIIKLYLSLSPGTQTLTESDITNLVTMQAEVLEQHIYRKADGLQVPRKTTADKVLESAKEIFNGDIVSDNEEIPF